MALTASDAEYQLVGLLHGFRMSAAFRQNHYLLMLF